MTVTRLALQKFVEGVREAGENYAAVEGLGLIEKGELLGGCVDLGGSGDGVDDPGESCSGGEVFAQLTFNFAFGVAFAEDFDGEIGREERNGLGRSFAA